MNHVMSITGLLTCAFMASCSGTKHTNTTRSFGSDGAPKLVIHAQENEDADQSLALDQIPDVVRAAATAAFPGLAIVAAEREIEDGVLLYSLEGVDNGVTRELEVSADGKSVHVEDGDDDEEDNGDEDNGDEDND